MKFTKIVVLVVLPVVQLLAQPNNNYYERNNFSLTTPGAMKYGLYGYDNPAVLSTLKQMDLYFTWSDAEGNWNDFRNWGIFAAVPNFGFSAVHNNWNGFKITDYKFSAGFGNPKLSFGVGYGWSVGRVLLYNRSNLYTAGTLFRPNEYLSLGVVGNYYSKGEKEGIVDLAVRPFGNEILSLFGDYLLKEDLPDKVSKWSAGVAVEAYPGIRLIGRYFENETMTLGLQLSFGSMGISSQSYYGSDNNHLYNSYGIRIGAYDRNPFTKLMPKKYIELNLKGRLKYKRFKLFDKSNTLTELIEKIDAAKNDENVSGIAINTSAMIASREMLWELREKIKDFKTTGKKVVIFVDRPNMDQYHFASVADKIILDPIGMLMLEGYLMGRSYLKGTLEKVGIGFDELRFFKYKSAVETFSEEKMTEADREQRQKLVDDYYKLAQKEICEGRNLSLQKFDELVDNEVIFLPQAALENGLVDTIGRWDAAKDIIKALEGNEIKLAGVSSLEKFKLPDDNRWGPKSKIALIYALGACAMDEGINARSLVKDVEKATEDPNVKAVVLRVDSPGGDGMASDYIAEALKKCMEKKPVIVSQGSVAASGGYWLSMYSDTIVAAPNTITGSIGVISMWYYNKDLKEKIGVTTDYVKRGKHADLASGFTFPLIGFTLPDRPLSIEERAKFESAIRAMYKEFLGKVASGRNKGVDEIHEIAQGRVWSGYDGLENGLVDVLGGIETAINIAKEKAGLKNKEVEIVELPEMPWLDLNMFMPKIFGLELKEDGLIKDLKFRMKNNGVPMPLLPVEFYDGQIDF